VEGARRSGLVRRFRHASVARNENESAGTRREDLPTGRNQYKS
jgi:hypothetical protein